MYIHMLLRIIINTHEIAVRQAIACAGILVVWYAHQSFDAHCDESRRLLQLTFAPARRLIDEVPKNEKNASKILSAQIYYCSYVYV